MKSAPPMLSLFALAAALAPAAQANLINSLTVSILYPNSSTVFNGATDSVAIGGNISCPGTSPICSAGYFDVTNFPVTFSATGSTITYSAAYNTFSAASFNGFSFSNLQFADSGTVATATLSSATNFPGLVQSDIAIGGGAVFVNLQGINTSGDPASFVLTLSEAAAPPPSVPEPGSFLLIACAILLLPAARFWRSDHGVVTHRE